MTCPLCKSSSKLYFENIYYRCNNCLGIFKDEQFHLVGIDEKNIYDKHVNIATDLRYQDFLSPITNSVMKDKKKNSIGLDFGCGKSSAIIEVLRNNNYKVEGYDLFYKNDLELLETKYDYITSSEVIEHFANPKKEFELFLNLLKKDGSLYLMTDIFDENTTDFSKWYYKNDPTHIFMYQKKSFEYIKDTFNFKDLYINKRLIKLYL
jgi:SAM-dependent methyltransferase